VVEIPALLWWIILHGIILPLRAGKSAAKYAMIWTKEGSPLKVHTKKQASLLRGYLGESGNDVQVAYAMRYGSPSLPEVLDQLRSDGCGQILILPAYPQYSGTTTASIFDAVFKHYATVRNIPELRFIRNYHDDDGYIQALKETVLAHWQANGRPEKLLISFHGVPKRTLLLGDPYHCECHKTARLLALQLGLKEDDYIVAFQSRFGKAEWLQPYTAPVLQGLGRDGVKRVDVICPGFTSDCLETLEEIAIEAKQVFLTSGGKEFHYIRCLNESPVWIKALSQIVERHMHAWPAKLSPAMREVLQQNAELTRQQAKRLGAKN
jgi:ferrochelatase